MSAQHYAKPIVLAAWVLLLMNLAAHVARAQDIAAASSAAPAPDVMQPAGAAVVSESNAGMAAAAAVAPSSASAMEVIKGLLLVLQPGPQGTGNRVASAAPGPRTDYYSQTCPDFFPTVLSIAVPRLLQNPSGIAAGLLRLHFHDCFIRGCDASVLLDITLDGTGAAAYQVEKASVKNERMRQQVVDMLDDIKAALENVCQGKVSAADVMALTTWTALKMQSFYYFSPKSLPVPLFGRQDSTTSHKEDAEGLPGSMEDPVSIAAKFDAKGFSASELAVLVGVHSIGQMACEYVQERINSNLIKTAPNRAYLTSLIKTCLLKSSSGADLTSKQAKYKTWKDFKALEVYTADEDLFAASDPTPTKFDSTYYSFVRQGYTPLHSDVALSDHPATAGFMRSAASNWAAKFAAAWTKLSNLSADAPGEVRNRCRCPNSVSDPDCAAARAEAPF